MGQPRRSKPGPCTRRRGWQCGTLAAALLLLVGPLGGVTPHAVAAVGVAHAAPARRARVHSLHVVHQRVVALPRNMDLLSYSRDGRFLLAALYNRSRHISLSHTATLVQHHCVAIRPLFSPTTVVWSPDGKRVALSNDLVKRGFIWIIDLRSGALSHVAQGQTTVPLYADADPAWSEGGRSLTFVRYDARRGREEIDRVSIGTAHLRHLLTRTRDTGPVLDGRSRLFPIDGDRALLYVSYSTATGVGRLMRADLATGRGRVVVATSQAFPHLPTLAGVTADGRTALVYYTALFFAGPVPVAGESIFALVDVNSGRVHPLLPARRRGSKPSYTGPLGAVLSPDGKAVVYLYKLDRGPIVVAVRDLRRGIDNVLPGHGLPP